MYRPEQESLRRGNIKGRKSSRQRDRKGKTEKRRHGYAQAWRGGVPPGLDFFKGLDFTSSAIFV